MTSGDGEADPRGPAERWAAALDAALSSGRTEDVATLFTYDALWKDLFVLGPQPRQFPVGIGLRTLPETVWSLSGFRLSPERTPPRRVVRGGRESLEFFLSFRMPGGGGEAVVRLVGTAGDERAYEMTTVVSDWDTAPERVGALRPGNEGDGTHRFDEPTWYERRAERARFDGREPEVVIVGGGQAGLALAARLLRRGVDALVLERHARIGDNWRDRYRSLRLHNTLPVVGLPYFPVPSGWETFLSKDRVGDWLEYYADAMDIPCWTAATVTAARFEDDRWSVDVEREGHVPRVLRPAHVVIATGLSGAPRFPRLAGLDGFAGDVLHSSEYGDGAAYRGRRALVVGAGSSGHDIAQDLHEHGAEVTMLQRGATTVSSVRAIERVLDAGYAELPQDDADLIGASFPYPSFLRVQREITRRLRIEDRVLLEGLEAAGFAVDFGDDETGPALQYLRRGGGFYLNVGCSDLIVAGDVRVIPSGRVAEVEPGGLRLLDGSLLELDLIVGATGFQSQRTTLAAILGEEVADRVGPVWGLDDVGFPRNTWRPTPVDGLWFMLGNFAQCRFYSKVLALQIAARVRPAAERATRPRSTMTGASV